MANNFPETISMDAAAGTSDWCHETSELAELTDHEQQQEVKGQDSNSIHGHEPLYVKG